MDNFDNIMANWKNQTIPAPEHTNDEFAKITSTKIKKAKNMQYKTIIVLGITLLVIGFLSVVVFCTQSASPLFKIGLNIMLLMLIIRIGIETKSISVIKKASMIDDVISYNRALIRIYKSRKRLHFVATYLIYALYVVGFCLLMPTFKQSLSDGFYQYITICAIVIFPVLAIFISIMNRKELKIINNAIKEMENLTKDLETID